MGKIELSSLIRSALGRRWLPESVEARCYLERVSAKYRIATGSLVNGFLGAKQDELLRLAVAAPREQAADSEATSPKWAATRTIGVTDALLSIKVRGRCR